MEDSIIVTINNQEVKLQSNNPNLSELIDNIIKQDDKYDFNEITIRCDNKDFDAENFKKIIVESIEKFKENLKIEEQDFNEKIEMLEVKKHEIDNEKQTNVEEEKIDIFEDLN